MVRTLPTSTTNITGLRSMSLGLSFGNAAMTAWRNSARSKADEPRRREATAFISADRAACSGVLSGGVGSGATRRAGSFVGVFREGDGVMGMVSSLWP